MLIYDGDEVAVFKTLGALPGELLEIATVRHGGPVFIELTDGRMFATLGGVGLNTNGCIAPATSEHRAALRKLAALENAKETMP
jgi:hypothetical protein